MATEYKLSYTAEEIDNRLGKVVSISEDVDSLQSNVGVIQGDVGSLQTDVGTLQTDIQSKAEIIQLSTAEFEALGGNASENTLYMLTDADEEVIEVPTKVSELENDSGYLTSYTETDPTVPAWAKTETKPTYTAEEVGALPVTTVIPTVPTNISAFTNDSGYLTEHQSLEGKQDKITGTAGQFVVIGDDGNVTTKTILNAEEVSF